jgi:hypothetical protein
MTMTQTETPAGTPVLELDGEEYARFLDEEARARVGLSAREFTEQYLAGALDDSDPDVPFLAGLLWIGQNGHRSAAA